jgi:GT2 family glycosyltransferase
MKNLKRKKNNSEPQAQHFQPIRMLEVDIGHPLPDISAFDMESKQRYQRAISLVRLHTQPLGTVELKWGKEGLTAAEYATQIWQALAGEIKEHLREDGLPQLGYLPVTGLPSLATARCQQEREKLLAKAPFVSVVIATRNRTASLAKCLSSLLCLDYPNYEIIVVDNAPSSDETAEFMSHNYGHLEQVRYVREDRPGLAVAHNRGLEEVKAPIVAFTDDDVLVDKYWLSEMVKGFNVTSGDRVGCVTGMIIPAELETPAQLWIEQYGGFSKGFRRQLFDLHENRLESLLYPYTAGSFGSGANMAFKTSVLRDIGGFDPALGAGSAALGGDDLAAFFEVVTQGYQLVYEPAAIVHHAHRRDYGGLRKQAYGYGVGLTAYLMKTLLDKPSRLFAFATKIPAGMYYIFSPRSAKNNKKQADYPSELTLLERKGMLYGPFAYLQSRRQAG